jgi:predicted GNAT family N-acyltransferase
MQLSQDNDANDMLIECRKVNVVVNLPACCPLMQFTKRFSKYRRSVRVLAVIRRFIHNCKARKVATYQRLSGALTVAAELEEAEKVLVKDAQSAIKPLIQKSELRNLAPFIDDDGIIRIRGRIENAPVSFETRHPPIIPRCQR